MPWQSAVSRLVPPRSETLHAQSKPPACVIGEITIKDEDRNKGSGERLASDTSRPPYLVFQTELGTVLSDFRFRE